MGLAFCNTGERQRSEYFGLINNLYRDRFEMAIKFRYIFSHITQKNNSANPYD